MGVAMLFWAIPLLADAKKKCAAGKLFHHIEKVFLRHIHFIVLRHLALLGWDAINSLAGASCGEAMLPFVARSLLYGALDNYQPLFLPEFTVNYLYFDRAIAIIGALYQSG